MPLLKDISPALSPDELPDGGASGPLSPLHSPEGEGQQSLGKHCGLQTHMSAYITARSWQELRGHNIVLTN